MEAILINDSLVWVYWFIAFAGLVFLVSGLDGIENKDKTKRIVWGWTGVAGFVFLAIGLIYNMTNVDIPTRNLENVEHAFNMEIVEGDVPAHLGDESFVVALLNDTDEYENCRIYINYGQEFEVTCGKDRRYERGTVRFENDDYEKEFNE